MGFSKTKKQRIQKYILEKIDSNDKKLVDKVCDNFDISHTTVYRYLKELDSLGVIKCNNDKYVLSKETHPFYYKVSSGKKLEEDEIYSREIRPLLSDLPDNVVKIWAYAFTEMMNNAIEHSEASAICGIVSKNYLYTSIIIADNGIGIFEKIKSYYGYETVEDAISELFKGKLTTDSENHSGEGIFFTSRMVDTFAALSGGKLFTHDLHFDVCRDLENVPDMEKWKDEKGTQIIMTLSNTSTRHSKEIFEMYSDPDQGFIKTQIPMKNIFSDGYPVSRSQAKRLTYRFDEFKEVCLDFAGVDDIGQGFAHELFVVFAGKNPQVKLVVQNANEDVTWMINHVKASQKSN